MAVNTNYNNAIFL